MLRKKFELDFDTQARTLSPYEVTGSYDNKDYITYTNLSYLHEDGWLIEGIIKENYYYWVNYFKASHKVYGIIEGDFEDEIHFESEEALDHFLKHHKYKEWDYWDI